MLSFQRCTQKCKPIQVGYSPSHFPICPTYRQLHEHLCRENVDFSPHPWPQLLLATRPISPGNNRLSHIQRLHALRESTLYHWSKQCVGCSDLSGPGPCCPCPNSFAPAK